MAVTPISPKEAREQVLSSVPDEVIESFNILIVKNLRNGRSTVMLEEVANLIASKLNIATATVERRGYLDIEPLFIQAGWIVKFEKPDRGEEYLSFYMFTEKDKC